jgi:hypothetical protein
VRNAAKAAHCLFIFILYCISTKVDVELLEDDTGWAPYISVEDAYRLDDVRDVSTGGYRVGGQV